MLQYHQTVAVFEGRGRIVDGARSNDDEKSVLGVSAIDDFNRLDASREDCGFGEDGLGDFVLEQIWGGERIVALNAPVLGILFVANLLVWDEEGL
jgi:hypothetical protein